MFKNIFKEKGILNGKRVLALVSVLTFMSGTTFGVVAANHTWRSSGNVVYDENGQQNVLFNKEDLDYLDNRIDEIENNTTLIKESFANNLNSWSTGKTLNSTSTATEIEEVLNYIKSTPQEGEQCTDSSGNLCYLKPDGSVTTTVSEAATDENGSPIALYYSKATSDSMSAGTVAWVDGQVIVGNGENNKSYHTSTPYAFLSFYNYGSTPNRTKLNVVSYGGFECDSNILTAKEAGTYRILCPQMYYRGLYVWINDNITFSCGNLGTIDQSITLNEGDQIYISVDDSNFGHTNKCGLIIKI